MGNVKIVSASAGSGKTYNLAYEYVRNVISDPTLYSHILAVTFTNKATEEMKGRILSKINDIAKDKEKEYTPRLQKELGLPSEEITARARTVRSLILHDYDHFAVVTIDKFFQRIIRSFIKELGIDLNFNLELPVESLLDSAADRMIDQISSDDTLRRWIEAFVDDKIEEGKQWNIRGELQNLGRELFKEDYKKHVSERQPDKKELQKIIALATAAAEKATEAITAPAKEFMKLAADNDLEISDFNYSKSGAAGYVAKIAEGTLSQYGKRVLDMLDSGKWASAKSPRKAIVESLSPQLTALLQAIVSAYDTGIEAINSASLLRENYRNFALLGDLRQKISEVSREENIVHISEINDMLSKLISGNDTPFIFEKAGNYFSHFMIDEFQDTSAMQWENFLPLLKNAVSQSEDTPVLLVGDVKQSIYRWRGGDWSILADRAGTEFDNAVRIPLQTNYRSRKTVVEFINAAIGDSVRTVGARINGALDEALADGRIDKSLHDELYDTASKAYADYMQYPADDSDEGYVTVTYYGETVQPAVPPVIETIEDLQSRGYRAGEIAILVRTNSQASAVASMLLARKSEYPDSPYCYDIITQDALQIGRSAAANFIVTCMSLSSGENSIDRAVYNRFLERTFPEELPPEEKEFLRGIGLMPPEEAFENIVMKYGLGRTDEEISYIQALHEQINAFTRSNVADIPLFLKWWNENGCTKSIPMPSEGNAITIDTIHRSKGLGYKAVIIPYCNWSMTTKTGSVIWSEGAEGTPAAKAGRFPVKYKNAMGCSHFAADFYREYVMSQIDNLNLLYVALTRAREELHIMMPCTGKAESENVGAMLDKAIVRNGTEAGIGLLKGETAVTDDGCEVRFGTAGTHSSTDAQKPPRLPGYLTVDTAGRMAVRLHSQRYAEDGANDGRLSPRDYGVLLHSIFAESATLDEITRNIVRLRENGAVSAEEADKLNANLENIMANPTVREWFDGSWDDVRNENDIIVPGGKGYRPDRVMTKGSKAVVIDYKFGLARRTEYDGQVRRYGDLLKEMGYTEMSGYVWYVNLGEIERVM